MGVYKAAVVPVLILFLLTGLIGHNTGRLREIPVVGGPWDDLTTEIINGVYEATGIYLGAVGTLSEETLDYIPTDARDDYLNDVTQSRNPYIYPYWSYTAFPREELPEILNSSVVQKFVDDVISEAERRVEAKHVPRNLYLLYLRGTAYEVMVERAKYCAGGPTKDPRYVVTHCGDCDDWHVVAYAIISKINLEHGVRARYFLTLTYDHGFLTVYYPDDKKWEIYDWFPDIGVITSKGIFQKYVYLDGYCPRRMNIPKSQCAVEIRRFPKYSSLAAFYASHGEGGIQYLFELPSLKYVEYEEIPGISDNPMLKHLNSGENS